MSEQLVYRSPLPGRWHGWPCCTCGTIVGEEGGGLWRLDGAFVGPYCSLACAREDPFIAGATVDEARA